MNETFFIADVHLDPDSPQRQKTVTAFIDYVCSRSGNLYILGDFFDFWANNRLLIQKYLPVFERLRRLTAQGGTVGFIYGNRDFLMSAGTLARFGVSFLGEEAEIDLGSLRAFITHGHTLCLNDARFFRYKNRMWPRFRLLDRLLPGRLENFIARKFILKSKQIISGQDQSRFQFTRSAIENQFKRGADAVICGHTHDEEDFSAEGKKFYALGCWEDAAGPYLVYRDGTFIRAVFSPAA